MKKVFCYRKGYWFKENIINAGDFDTYSAIVKYTQLTYRLSIIEI